MLIESRVELIMKHLNATFCSSLVSGFSSSKNSDSFKIMPKDSYNILYTEEQIDGKVVGIKNIKAAKFFHDNSNYYAIAYDQGFGDDYFD